MLLQKGISTVLLFFVLNNWVLAQSWIEDIQGNLKTVYDIDQAFEDHWQNRSYEKGKGYKQYFRWKDFIEPRVFPHGEISRLNEKYWEGVQEHQFLKKQNKGLSDRAGNWTPLGPFDWNSVSYNPGTGRVNVIAEDPNNPNILYAGTPSGGIWKSTTGGGNWTPLNDDFVSIGVSGIAIDPSNSQVLYIGTGDGDGADSYSIGVMKSTDGGQSWSPTGLVHTTGQGITTRKLIMHPSNFDVLFLASNQGLYRTSDGGQSWSLVFSGSIRDVEFKPGDPHTVYMCTDQFYRSTDGGLNFSLISSGISTGGQINRMSIAVSPDEPNYVYALAGQQSDASFRGLWLSTNSGQSFTLQVGSSTNFFGYEDDGSDGGGQSSYDMALAVNPMDASEVLIGGINVWQSTDYGQNFSINTHWVWPSIVEYVHADIHTIDFFGGSLYCGSDGGLYKSTNAGSNWSRIDQGLQIMQFYRFGGTPQNSQLLIGGAQDNGSNVMNGTQWTHVFGADGMEAAIDPTNQQIMYSSSQFGGIRKSTDGGNNFSSITGTISGSGDWVTPYLLDPNNSNTVYIGYDEVWMSLNGGNTFAQISNFGTGTNLKSLTVAPSNSSYIYAATFGNIYRTTNGGNTWNNINNNLPGNAIRYIVVHPNNPNIVYVCQSGFSAGEKVFVSTNGGQTWTNISNNLPNLPANCLTLAQGTLGGIYVGTDLGVYYTDSSLSNWQAFSDNLPNVSVREMEIHYGTGMIRAATYGRGMWESPTYAPSNVPPNAYANYEEKLFCAGDSVQFLDASTNAAPGWTWYFPGGSPSTSNLANPRVFYPSSGTYTASLVVQNNNGSDSTSISVQVDYASHELSLEVVTDDYPAESSWTITDTLGQLIYEFGSYASTNQTYSHTICLNDGCYIFTMLDSYGDGICCSSGAGSYTLKDPNGNTIVTGGDFGFSESTQFCVPDGLGIDDESSLNFQLYPNPSKNLVNIEVDSRAYSIDVLDMKGRLLRSVQKDAKVSHIDISSLPSGIYLVRVRDLDQLIWSTKRLIKLQE